VTDQSKFHSIAVTSLHFHIQVASSANDAATLNSMVIEDAFELRKCK